MPVVCWLELGCLRLGQRNRTRSKGAYAFRSHPREHRPARTARRALFGSVRSLTIRARRPAPSEVAPSRDVIIPGIQAHGAWHTFCFIASA
jgi:hypothetical protein